MSSKSSLPRWFVALVLVVFAPLSAAAAPMEIIASPQNTQSPFRHNVFHTAESGGGMFGDVLAWFDLDTDGSNTYDPDTGDLFASFEIFSESALSNNIGFANAVGTALLGSTLGDGTENDVIVGNIRWDIFIPVGTASDFAGHLEEHYQGVPTEIGYVAYSFTTFFADILYMTSPDGRTPNSWDDPYLSLWGTDGQYIGVDKFEGNGGPGGFVESWTGVDLVIEVPEPQVSLLAGIGMLGLWIAGRRTRSCA